MTISVLALILLLAVGALSAVPALADLLPHARKTRPLPLSAGLGILAALGLAACLTTLLGGGSAILPLPLSLPGSPVTLTLDPLAALLLSPVLLAAATSFAALRSTAPAQLGALLALSLLLLLAADPPTLTLAAVATLLLLDRIARPGRPVRPLAALLTGACLAAALTLLPDAPNADANTAAGATGYALALLAGLCLAALPPLTATLPSLPPSSIAPAIATSLRPLLGMALLLRLLVAHIAAPPAWWCAAPLALGALAAVSGAATALIEPRLDRIAAGLARQSGGAALTGLGLVLLARASDLPLLAALALAGTLLQLITATLGLLLLALTTEAIANAAGSRHLDRLGGLIHTLSGAAWPLLAGLASLAALPFTAGFAAAWLLLQAALTAMRAASPAPALLILLALAGLAAATGLSAIAATRLFAVACLGRPRTPRAAAAAPPPRAMRLTLAALATLLTALGLAPSLGLNLVVPALAALPEGGLLAAQPNATLDMIGLAPLLLFAAALALALLLRWLVRTRCQPPLPAEVWNAGFARPPPWLPFGDPALQASATALAWPLAELLPRQTRLAWPLAPHLRRLARQPLPSAQLLLPMLLIAALAWLWLSPGPTR